MRFNINDKVRIRLTEEGRRIHREHWARGVSAARDLGADITSGIFAYRPPAADQEGYTPMQLWEVMEMFGPFLFNGCRLPFETEIDVPVKGGEK